MSDSYAHRHTALQALKKCDLRVANKDAFIWGANGPDPLFYYYIYSNKGKDIRDFGHRMHQEKTGEFLKNLYHFADTEVKQSYFLGFLCHYATDSTMHPFVYDHTTQGGVYDIVDGHSYLESAMDWDLAVKDGFCFCKFSKLCAPKLEKVDLQEISTLFQKAVLETYGVLLDVSDIDKAFYDFRFIKSYLNGNGSIFAIFEKVLKKRKGYITSHIQPAVMGLDVKDTWYNHFSREITSMSFDEMIDLSIERCTKLLEYASLLFIHPEAVQDFYKKVGNLNYETGLEII